MKVIEIGRGYLLSFLLFSIAISIPSSFLFLIGINNSSWRHIVFWGGILVVAWSLFAGLKKKSTGAFWISLILSSLVWSLLLLQSIRRILFIIENGGMERADGLGSPLAFLIGVVGEQVFFLPLCLVVGFGWLSCIRRLGNPEHDYG